MLAHLTVRDFAIVERLELDLQPGMTVITGETGAGKSILVDALSLALGERAISGVIRCGGERADVVATFDISGLAQVQDWLREHELDAPEQECILRRSVSLDGRSRAFINARQVPVQTLRSLGSLLVDIHGQHAHQSLVRRSIQRQILDDYAGHDAWLGQIASLSQRWNTVQRAIEGGDPNDQHARLDLLKYQAQELRDLDLNPETLSGLFEEHQRLSHSTELLEACRTTLERIASDSDTSVLTHLAAGLRALSGLIGYDQRLEAIQTLLDNAVIHVQEAAGELHRYMDTLELDPERLQWIEERLSTIHALGRKHHVQPADLPSVLVRLDEEIALIENSTIRMRELREQLKNIQSHYRKLAQNLRQSRHRASQTLAQKITTNMQHLGMPAGRLEIVLEPDQDHRPSPFGIDQIDFQVSVNPGQPLQSLGRVASGGELSRIGLAIQVIVARDAGIPMLIFDEVDAGIGGGVAEIVGQQLRLLGGKRQVLCVTHLPQVASQAHHHLQVRKRIAKNATRTGLERLSGENRVRELARMLGGVKITAQTLAHAREMLDRY